MAIHRIQLVLFQKDYFVNRKRVFNNIRLVTSNKIRYIPLSKVLELLEYDNKGNTKVRFLVRMVLNSFPFYETELLRQKKALSLEWIL